MNIFIEASIGVGKSSLIKNLELKFKDWKMSSAFFKEPVELWEKTKAGNLLLQFSKDPKICIRNSDSYYDHHVSTANSSNEC